MTVQVQESIRTPSALRYQGRDFFIKGWDEANETLNTLREAMNHNFDSQYKTLRSLQESAGDSIDDEGKLKKRMTSWQVKEHAIRSENLDKNIRPFITNLAFSMIGGGVNLTWWAFPLGSLFGQLFWAGDPLGTPSTAINAGVFVMAPGSIRYAYIDTINDTSPYTVQLAVFPVAAKDLGRVLLCQAFAIANHDYRISLWGGGCFVGW